MIIFDTNIVIYSAKQEYAGLRSLFFRPNTSISILSKVEVLGFYSLENDEQLYFESIFKTIKLLPIDLEIIDKAIELRQQKKMSLGDSIIAATSIVFDAELYTRNVSDFKHIRSIKVFNPIV
jgi:predicted nucleic acid-binding protein